MDGNLVNATSVILKGLDSGWTEKKITEQIYLVAPVFKSGEHPKYMYGILTYDNQIVLMRVEERHPVNVIEIVFNKEE